MYKSEYTSMQSDNRAEEGSLGEPRVIRSRALVEAQLTTLLNEPRDFIAVNNFEVLWRCRHDIAPVLHH